VKSFRFRLDPVLGQRERVEQERAGEHARVLAEQLAAERSRDDLVARRDTARASLRDGHAALDAETLRATYAHLEYLDRAIRAAEQRADACAAETARSQARLIEAARDRKVLETLKDRRREAYQLEAAQAEQRELDDQNARLFERADPFEGLRP
jgi:flagellar FliJ protein